MGRRKSCNRKGLIDKATNLFRSYGYAGTSADILSSELGVNRYGIYAEFGSKLGLFNEVLQHYYEYNVDKNFGPLEAQNAGIKEIETLFEFFGKLVDGSDHGRGCLLCNTAVEFGAKDPSGKEFVQKYLNRISSAFQTALTHAACRGEISSKANIKQDADFFTASTLGLFVMLRAKANEDLISNAANAAIAYAGRLRIQDSSN